MIASSASVRARSAAVRLLVLADRAERALDVADVGGVEHGALARRRPWRSARRSTSFRPLGSVGRGRREVGSTAAQVPAQATRGAAPRGSTSRSSSFGCRMIAATATAIGTSRQLAASSVGWASIARSSAQPARAPRCQPFSRAPRPRAGATPRAAAARARHRRRSRRPGVPSSSTHRHRDQVVVGHQPRDLRQRRPRRGPRRSGLGQLRQRACPGSARTSSASDTAPTSSTVLVDRRRSSRSAVRRARSHAPARAPRATVDVESARTTKSGFISPPAVDGL